MNEVAVDKMSNALYAYMHIPSFRESLEREYVDVTDSIVTNLEWLARLNNLPSPNRDEDIDDQIKNSEERLVETIWDIWRELYWQDGNYEERRAEFEYTYKGSANKQDNGKKVTFILRKYENSLELIGINDQVNPGHNHGFDFPHDI